MNTEQDNPKKPIAYELISFTPTNNDPLATLRQALGYIDRGWRLGSYPNLTLRPPYPWAYLSDQDRSWNYYVHAWNFLDEILLAHSNEGFDLLLKPAIEVALDWTKHHIDSHGERVTQGVSQFAWYDMAVGKRAYRLAYIIDSAKRSDLLDEVASQKLWQCLLAHQRYLAIDDNIMFHNNHGYYQAAGQLAMGRRFRSQDKQMQAAYEQGIQRLDQMLRTQFSLEGVHLEHSPAYHRMVYETLMGLIQAGLIHHPQVLEFTRTIETALSWFVRPNGHLVNFGDTDSGALYSSPDDAKTRWQTQAMRFVVTDGKIGELPEQTLKVFKDSGYYIVRRQCDHARGSYHSYSYLAQTAAFHSRTHKHADDLSFIWFEHSQDVLIDAGRYGYIGKTQIGSELWQQGYWYSDPKRIYCESTRAHNTLEFDGLNYPRKGVPAYGSAIGRSHEYDNGLVVLESECKHFQSIRRVRVLIYMPSQWLIVFDWFKDNCEDTHDVRQWFNFASNLHLIPKGNGYLTELTQDELHIFPLLADMQASVIFHGEEEPQLQGWYSPANEQFEPTDSVHFLAESKSTTSLATLFTFNGHPNIDKKKNQVNISGRRIKLSWQDLVGIHTLVISRPKDDDINVEYEVGPQ